MWVVIKRFCNASYTKSDGIYIRNVTLLFTVVHADPFVNLIFNCKVRSRYNEIYVKLTLNRSCVSYRNKYLSCPFFFNFLFGSSDI